MKIVLLAGGRAAGAPETAAARDYLARAAAAGRRIGVRDAALVEIDERKGDWLDAAPRGVEVETIKAAFLALPGVTALHDLHVWGLSTTETALTAHLVHDRADADALLAEAQALARTRFSIRHTTLQLESGAALDCADC